jgi:hypothetical protein
VLLHDRKELDDDLGAWADQDLTLTGLLGIVDGVERIVQDGGLHVGGCGVRFSSGDCGVRCLCRILSAFKSHPERKECPSGSHGRQHRKGFFSSTIVQRSSVNVVAKCRT